MRARIPLLVLLLVGCAQGAGKQATPTDTDASGDTAADTGSDTDVAAPSITLLTPADGATVYSTATLGWAVTDFVLDPVALAAGDTAAVDGQGHVHVKVDGAYVAATAEEGHTLEGLPAGAHTLAAVLAANDHTELDASDAVTVNVLAPAVRFLTPADGATLEAGSAVLAFDVSDFALSPDVGGAAVVGEGHFHVSLDGAYVGYGVDPSRYLLPDLSPGEHTVGVELVHSDHSSLVPPVSATVTVTVPADAPAVRIDDAGLAPLDSSAAYVPVSVANFVLAPDAVGGPAVEGEGHYHVYLDGAYVGASADSGVWLYGLAAGAHTVEVRLAASDHTEQAAFDVATVDVSADRPSIAIDAPVDGENVGGSGFFVSVAVEGFSLVDPLGTAGNAPDEGHWHLYVDGAYYAWASELSTLVLAMDPGVHTLQVALANNDHSPLDVPVWSAPIAVTTE